jgi:hypothetical protein
MWSAKNAGQDKYSNMSYEIKYHIFSIAVIKEGYLTGYGVEIIQYHNLVFYVPWNKQGGVAVGRQMTNLYFY